MDKFDWFKNEFELNLSSAEQADIYNHYCGINHVGGYIYPMSDINDYFNDCTPLEILTRISPCYFDANDNYFASTTNGLESFNNVELYVDDYLADIYKCKEAWEKDIDEGGYFDAIYEEFYSEKPQDMDDDEYYDLIDKAVKQYELESQIVAYLGQNME